MSKRREHEDDDGRTIADMNVEGMPWYRPESQQPGGEKPSLSPREARAATWGALKAALLVVLVFAVVFFLVILFMDLVWLK